MRMKSERLAAGIGLLLAVLSLSPLARGQAQKHISISSNKGSVDISAGPPTADKLGLHVYPGAVSREKGDDAGANLNVTTSGGAARLQIMKFISSDSAPKVLAFYKKELGKYGAVLECRGEKQMTLDVHDSGETHDLSCEKDDSANKNSTLLKSGTVRNQRIVAVESTDKGTEFTLIHIENSGGHETL
jgi:hypothetical protein